MSRMKNITELLALLQKCLPHHPTFIPPPAIFDCDTSNVLALSSTSKSKSAGDGKKKGGKKKGAKGKNRKGSDIFSKPSQRQCDNGMSQTRVVSQESQSGLTEKDDDYAGGSLAVNLGDYRLFFRELNFKVFGILNTSRIRPADTDSSLHTKPTEDLQIIGLPELQYLLEDLSLKLDHSLVAKGGGKRLAVFKAKTDKTGGFSNLDLIPPTQIAEKSLKLLPALCDHLESICLYFQQQIEANDGLVDGPGRYSKESGQMASCYHLLMKSILSFYSWNGFNSDVNSKLLKAALMVVVSRIRQDQSSTYLSLEESTRLVFSIWLCSLQQYRIQIYPYPLKKKEDLYL